MDETQSVVDMLMEDADFRAEYEAHLLAAYELLLHGKQGFGKNRSPKEKLMWDYYKSVPIDNIDNVRKPATISADSIAKPKLPQKVCNYSKPKLYWYGEMHSSNNYIWNEGFTMSRHWDVTATKLHVHGADPSNNMSVWPAKPMGSTTGRNPLEGKRFIGISEQDEWVETKTYDKKSATWKPQGEIFIMSGKPLKINER